MTSPTVAPSTKSGPASRLQLLLLLAASIEIAVGLFHFAMPYFAHKSAGISRLSGAEEDFLVLVTFSTGILLIAFGSVTLMFARDPGASAGFLYPYLLIKSVLWAARLILEVLFPVRLEMFWIDPFTLAAAPGMVLEFSVFVAAAVLANRLRREAC